MHEIRWKDGRHHGRSIGDRQGHLLRFASEGATVIAADIDEKGGRN
jgi:hypothetical protein